MDLGWIWPLLRPLVLLLEDRQRQTTWTSLPVSLLDHIPKVCHKVCYYFGPKSADNPAEISLSLIPNLPKKFAMKSISKFAMNYANNLAEIRLSLDLELPTKFSMMFPSKFAMNYIIISAENGPIYGWVGDDFCGEPHRELGV